MTLLQALLIAAVCLSPLSWWNAPDKNWWAGRRRRALRRRVFENLDNARANGYFDVDEHCHGMSAEDLAQDLMAFSVDFEDVSAAWTLVPYVEEWKRQRQL